MGVSCHRPFLLGTSLVPAVIPTAEASSFTLLIIIIIITFLSRFCRVFTVMYLQQTMFLGYIVLPLFCIYNLCYV